MGWLLATFSTIGQVEERRNHISARIRSVARHHFVSTKIELTAGGIDATCLAGNVKTDHGDWQWIVLGLGLRRNGMAVHVMDELQWSQLLAQPSPRTDDLDGHFVALRWNDAEVQCFCDQLGMRSLYFTTSASGLILSTRLDWLTPYLKDRRINFHAFGAHWLLFNQVENAALVDGVGRLGPGGRLSWNGQRLEVSDEPWTVGSDRDGESIEALLQAYSSPLGIGNRKISLGLSGGFDSRVLLAILANSHVATHVFGNIDDPDVVVSRRIAKQLRLTQQHLDDTIPDCESLVAALKEYTAATCAIEPATAIVNLRYYSELESQGFAIVDGGLGEIARRAYLKRLALRGVAALRARDVEGVLPYLVCRRPDFFKPEVAEEMWAGARLQVAGALDRLSVSDELSEGNLVDLFAIRTRFPYYAGIEQSRTDSHCLSIMPFAQPTVLRSILKTSHPQGNNRLLRGIIRSKAPILTRYPLVKGDILMPFGVPPMAAAVWSLAKRKLGNPGPARPNINLLSHLREFIFDTLQSGSVRNYHAYDARKVEALVTSYYAGRAECAPALSWWLAFEMWRQSLGAEA